MKNVCVTRDEAIKALFSLIDFSKRENVSKIIECKDARKLEQVAEKMDDTPEWDILDSYMEVEYLRLTNEIPFDDVCEMAFIMWVSEYDNYDFWEDDKYFLRALFHAESDCCGNLYDIMSEGDNISDLDIDEFLGI